MLRNAMTTCAWEKKQQQQFTLYARILIWPNYNNAQITLVPSELNIITGGNKFTAILQICSQLTYNPKKKFDLFIQIDGG